MGVRGVVAVFILTALAALGGCATSTSPGAVGVSRSQLLMVPSARINAMAAEGYTKLSTAAGNAGKLNSDSALTTRVRGIASKLIAQVGFFRSDASSWGWQINVIESEQLNAFCMPGGKIAVYSGLVNKLELTDSEIAAVVGHEIAHALREHTREKVSQQTLTNAIAQGIANSNSRYAATGATFAQLSALLFLHLPYSRDMELEADVMGLELMARAGYDPRLASNIWTKMQMHSGSSSKTDFFSTHPNHEKRIAGLDSAVEKVLPLYAAADRDRVGGNEESTPAPSALASTSDPEKRTPTLTPERAPVDPPATAQVLVSTASPSRKAQSGQYSFIVEQMARRQQCHADPTAVLTGTGPSLELYSVACRNGDVWSVRCEWSNCRVLK